MDILFKTFLVLHIIGGATGLIAGTINTARKKGDKTHRQSGKIFLYAMLTAGFSSLVLSVLHSNYFLFIVGILAIYLTSTGQRYLLFKQTSQIPGKIDWILTSGILLTAIIFICLGILRLLNRDTFGIVFIVFGVLGIRFFMTDFANYKGKSKIKNYWLTGHFQRMIGSYIAALTAFLVVNGKYIPSVFPAFVVWLLPTAILLPLIIIWTRKYKVAEKNYA